MSVRKLESQTNQKFIKKNYNIHQFDTIENFSASKNGNFPNEYTSSSTNEVPQKSQKSKAKMGRYLSSQMKKKSGIFKLDLSKGSYMEKDKIIKSFTPNDNELQESLNEISGMDLTSPNIYQTNQEEKEIQKNIYKTVQEESLDRSGSKANSFLPKNSFKPVKHKVISRKRDRKKFESEEEVNDISTSQNVDEEQKAKEVGIMLNQSLYLEKPEKSMNFVLLSWERDFYEHICEVKSTFETKEKQLLKMLSGDWRKKFNKKGVIFFFFIIEWCAYVKSTLVVKHISWSKIPGYGVGLTR